MLSFAIQDQLQQILPVGHPSPKTPSEAPSGPEPLLQEHTLLKKVVVVFFGLVLEVRVVLKTVLGGCAELRSRPLWGRSGLVPGGDPGMDISGGLGYWVRFHKFWLGGWFLQQCLL